MKMTSVDIRNFRSISKLKFDAAPACVLAGPNSCGKSNILRAIKFALLEDYSVDRLSDNFPVFVTGPSAEISVTMYFDQPIAAMVASLPLPASQPFSYSIAIKRNGKRTFRLNGTTISATQRQVLLDHLLVVFVPPIRDISSDGLSPLRGLLAKALKKAKKGKSISSLNNAVRTAFVTKGAEVLARAGNSLGAIVGVNQIAIDANSVDVSLAVDQLGLEVQVQGRSLPLSVLGTGHQSQVVMNLFGSLGTSFPGQVLYMFEEPDNHLHPTALLAVAEKIRGLGTSPNSQVIASSHSAAFIGAFPICDVTVLSIDQDLTAVRSRSAVSQRRIHALTARYGLKPIEALVSRAVILVEGATDVSMIRAFSREFFGFSPEQRDVLVVPCGGKTQVVELNEELSKLGVHCFVVLDHDASLSGSPPYLKGHPLSAGSSASIQAAAAALTISLSPKHKKVAATIASIVAEATGGPPPAQSFVGSPVEAIAKSSNRLNAASLSQAGAALLAGKKSKWRAPLSLARMWVWSSDPESLLASVPGAVNTVNTAFAAIKSGIPPLQVAASQSQVQNWLHNQASEPEVHEAVAAALLRSDTRSAGELRAFVRFLRNVYA